MIWSFSLGDEVASFLKSATWTKPQREGSTGLGVFRPNEVITFSITDFASTMNSDTGVHLTPETAGLGKVGGASLLGSVRVIKLFSADALLSLFVKLVSPNCFSTVARTEQCS